jgi:hypothetical protein
MTNPSSDPAIAPPPALPPRPVRRGRGYLNPRLVRGFAFWVITACIVLSVSVSIMAIWNPDQSEALWKTLATSLVIASGCGIFAALNATLGAPSDGA